MSWHPKAVCERYQITAKRSFSQNFLWDEALIRIVASAFPLDAKAQVLEVGPGLGALTAALLEQGAEVTAIELDTRMEAVLTERFQGQRLRLVMADALEKDWTRLCQPGRPSYLYANLPYAQTSEMVQKAFLDLSHAEGFCLMMQREAAARIFVPCGSKAYGPLAVLAALYGRHQLHAIAGAAAFYPSPRVQSRVIKITRHEEGAMYRQAEALDLLRFLQAAFRMRRKTLLNNLEAWGELRQLRTTLEQLRLAPMQRAEQLTPVQLLDCFRLLKQQMPLDCQSSQSLL